MAILLQSFPLVVQANFIKDLLKKFKLPDEIKLIPGTGGDEEGNVGDVKMANWTLLNCLGKRIGLTECDPFSLFDLGESQVSLLDEEGKPDIAQPEIPEICELRVPLSPEQELLTKEERLSLSRACSDLRRIQRAAVNQVYFAKKIFNRTDPLSDCLFVKNCKSSCSLRFGEISYTISILDVAAMFLPIGWVNTIRKVLSFIAKLNKIREVYNALKTVYENGVTALNTIFKEAAYLKTFLDSFKYILAMVEEGTNVGKLFEHYSDNLFKFTRAKSEAQTLIRNSQIESLELINSLKNEPGVSFLFYDESKREELQGIIDDYVSQIETPDQLIGRLKGNGVPVQTTIDREQNNPLDLSCPQEPTSCFVSYSSIPDYCSASLSNGIAFLECPEIIYEVSCASTRNAFGEDERSYTFELVKGPASISTHTEICAGQDEYWQQVCPPYTYCDIPEEILVDCSSAEMGCYDKCDFGCNPYAFSQYCTTEYCKTLREQCYKLQTQGWSWHSGGGGCQSYPYKYFWGGELYNTGKTCELSYPQEFGEYRVSCEQIPGSVRISCPGDCIFSCASPGNNWFNILYGNQGIYENIRSLSDKVDTLLGIPWNIANPEQGPFMKDLLLTANDTLNEVVSSLRPSLSSLISSLPKYWTTTTHAFPGDTKYWATTSESVSANTPEDALTQARATCQYDAELIFFDWDSEIQVIQEAKLESLKQFLEYLLTASTVTVIESLSKPLVNFKIQKMEAELGAAAINPDFQQASTTIRQLKGELEVLRGDFSDLNEDIKSWSQQEAISTPRAYISNLIDIKNTSKNISEDSLLESKNILSQLIALGITNQDFINLLGEISLLLGEIENFLGSYECPGQGFLNQLNCFEVNNGKTFEDIKQILIAIEELENVALTFDKIRENVSQIKPSLEIRSLEAEDVKSFEQFAEELWQSPLSYLNDLFYGDDENGIDDYLAEIEDYLTFELEIIAILSPSTLDEIKKIKDEKLPTLELLVFGNENLRDCCGLLDSILKRDPEDVEEECTDPANTCLLSGNELITNCQFSPDLTELILGLTGNQLADDCQFRDTLNSVLTEKELTIENLRAIGNLKEWWETNICSVIPDKIIIGWEKVCKRGKGCGMRPEWGPNPAFENCMDFAAALDIEYIEKLLTEIFKKLCIELQYQKALKKDCDDFELLKKALKAQCDSDENCLNLSTKLLESCVGCDSCPWTGTIPDLTLFSTSSKEELNKIRFLCATELNDIRTPLEEVLKVYAILLGIKSSTRFIAGIKTSIEDAKKTYESAQELITMIKELPGQLEGAWAETKIESGFEIGMPECIARPAVSYSYIDDKEITGVEGGPVCPRINYLFAIIESNFALMRQSLNHINLLRKEKKYWTIEIGQLRATLLEIYLPYNEGKGPYYEKVNSLYNQAKEIKKRAQNLWGVATAINFANTNCTCGQSFCKFPFCISGLPLTLAPLKDPYCYLVYILRYVLKHQAEVLEGHIK